MTIRGWCLGALLLAPFAALAPHAVAETVNWPQPGLSASHTAFNSAEATLSASNVADLRRAWVGGTLAPITAPPVDLNGVVYALSTDGNLRAFNAGTGARAWKFDAGAANTAWGVAAAGTAVYFNCHVKTTIVVPESYVQDGVCAVNANTGALLWKWALYEDGVPPVPASSTPASVPVVANGLVIIGESTGYPSAHPGYLYALNAATGAVVWGIGNCGDTGSNSCDNLLTPPPAVANGYLYYGAGLQNPAVAGANLGVCKRPLTQPGVNAIWCHDVVDSQDALALTVSGNEVLFATSPNNGTVVFHALNAETGEQIWSASVAQTYTNGHFAPAVADGIVYFSERIGNFGRSLFAFTAARGKPLWSYTVGGSGDYLISGVSVANGVVYASCAEGPCAFNATTGKLLWSPVVSRYGSENATPLVANGALIGPCLDNDVCAWAIPAK